METIEIYRRKMEDLLRQAREQRAALKPLSDSLERESKWLFRYDQSVRLRYLKASIMHKVSDALEDEARASSAFPVGDLVTGVMAFTTSLGIMAITGQKKKPWILELLLNNKQSRRRPFGKVLLALGPQGLPDGVEVITLSRLAREGGVSESEASDELQAKGHILMTPEDFYSFLGRLEPKVLDGTISLPVSLEQIRSELTRDEQSLS